MADKRLIDANALWADIMMLPHNGDIISSEEVEQALIDAPTVDAVEVVRCKECRWARRKDHREPTGTPRGLICQCSTHHHIPAPWGARLAVDPDDFCSYGERRLDHA